MSKENNKLIHDEENVLKSLQKDSKFSSIRQGAYDNWKKTPIPTTRDEYWKYTRLAPLLKKTYNFSSETSPFDTTFLREIDAYNLVFVDGIFSREHSDCINENDFVLSDLQSIAEKMPERITKYFKGDETNDYFSLLNTAFYQNGPFIHLGKNKVLDKPVRIAHLATESDRLVNIKGLIIAEANSEAHIIETWDNSHATENLYNSRFDIDVHENAGLELIKIQSIGSENGLINQEFIEQEASSRFTISTVSMDGKMIRNNLNITLNGQGAESNLNGLYMLKGNEHVDNHTKVNHAVPNCESNELYKGILNEKSKGVFNGKVVVSRDAQKTNAFQYNGNILLTDEAQVYSKPELEIYADDVKCSHGSTTGQLDEEALFYLESRGISKDNARNLLLKAFAMEVLDKISLEEIRDRIDHYLSARYHTDDV